jgi:HK97 family phage major capsid protein
MNPQQLAELKAALEQKVADSLITQTQATEQLKAAFDGLATQVEVMKSKLSVSLPGVDESTKASEQFSFARAYYGLKTGRWADVPFEKDVMDQANKLVSNDSGTQKLLAAGTGSTGGFVVPSQVSRQLIELLYAQSIAMKLGATRLNPTGIPFEIPKMVGGAFATWADEGAIIPESQGSFGKISMTPKYLTSLVPMSDRVAQYSDPAMEMLVRKDMITQMDLALDYGAFFADGQNNSPMGLVNQPGISVLETGANGDEPSYDFLLQLQGLVEDANALEGTLGFASCPALFRRIRQQKVPNFSGQTDGTPMFSPIMSDAKLAEQIGNFQKTTAIPKTKTKGGSGATLTSLFYGNWSEFLIALWGGLVLKASDQRYFEKNITVLKGIMEADVGIRHPESFAYAPYMIRA